MATDTNVFARIIKQDKQPDGTLLVTGIATDATLDADEQVCDPAWLKSAMPDWFRWGNIREQHSNIAAGVATEYAEVDDRHFITAHVVEPTSVKKVETGVLKGFSIGIRQPRVVKDDKAAGGRIVDGQIVEVSLVDRPANPSCTLSLAKAEGATLRRVETLKEMAVDEESTGKMDDTEETADEEKSGAPKAAAADEESSQAVGEESSQQVGEESSREGGVAGVAGKADDGMCPTCSKMYDMVAKMCDKMFAAAEDEGDGEKALTGDLTKAVAALTARLESVEEAATTKAAPVRMAVSQPEPAVNTAAIKANEYRMKAMNTADPKLAAGYLALAIQHDKTL